MTEAHRTSNLLLTLAAAIVLSGCTKPPAPATARPTARPAARAAAELPTTAVKFSMGACAIPKPVTFRIANAPAFETILQRWKRTKANFHAAQKAESSLENAWWNCMFTLENDDLPYFEAFQKAEKALASARCGQVCIPEKTQ